jgi:addiction module HigA family antidote
MRVNTHPGEVLREEFMTPLGLSVTALACALDVPPTCIAQIIATTAPRAVTPDMASRLGRYFATTKDFWLALQADYDRSVD